MKKLLSVLVLALLAGTAMYAAGARETITVEGKIAVTKTVPSIVSGDKTWILPSGPFYQIAWENNIKVGDAVKAEGFVRESRDETDTETMFMPTKIWINGKQLDLSTISRNMGPDKDNRPGMGGRDGGPGSGGCFRGNGNWR